MFSHFGFAFAVLGVPRACVPQKYLRFSSLLQYPDSLSPLHLILENFVGILYL